MPVNPDDPTIATACEDVALPIGVASDDCFLPELNYGPIRNGYYTRKPFAATPTAAEINRRLALFDTAPNDPEAMIGPLVWQLTKQRGTPQFDRINGRNYPKPAEISFDVTIQDTKPAWYDWMRAGQQGGVPGYFYGVDSKPYWIGGQNGLLGSESTFSSGYNWPADETALQTITGTISAFGYFDPPRMPSPVPVK